VTNVERRDERRTWNKTTRWSAGLEEKARRAVVIFFSSFLFLAKLLLLSFVSLKAFGTKKGRERGIRKDFRTGFKDFEN
jgi:hypothetical protein